jgi:hypothetical protein
MIFAAAGTPHGARNMGDEPATFLGVFGSSRFTMRYLERNTAPGTESSPPQPPFQVDIRAAMQAGDGVAR